MEKSCTTRTALALARRPSSEIIRVRVLRTLAAATIRGRRLFRSELFDSAATIRGRRLFEEIYGTLISMQGFVIELYGSM